MELILMFSLFGTIFSATTTTLTSTGLILQARPTIQPTFPVASNETNATEVANGQGNSVEIFGNYTNGLVVNVVDSIATNMSEKDIHGTEGVGPDMSRNNGSVAIGEITILKETKIAGKAKTTMLEEVKEANGNDMQHTRREFGQVKNATYVPKCSEVDDPMVQCAMDDFPLDMIPSYTNSDQVGDTSRFSNVKNVEQGKQTSEVTTTQQSQDTTTITQQSSSSVASTSATVSNQTVETLASTQSQAAEQTSMGSTPEPSVASISSGFRGDTMASTVEARTSQSQNTTGQENQTVAKSATTASPVAAAADVVQKPTESQTALPNNEQPTTHLQTTSMSSIQETTRTDTVNQTTVQTQESTPLNISQTTVQTQEPTPLNINQTTVQTQEPTTMTIKQTTTPTLADEALEEVNTCPILSCSTECRHGSRLDRKGCPICACLLSQSCPPVLPLSRLICFLQARSSLSCVSDTDCTANRICCPGTCGPICRRKSHNRRSMLLSILD